MLDWGIFFSCCTSCIWEYYNLWQRACHGEMPHPHFCRVQAVWFMVYIETEIQDLKAHHPIKYQLFFLVIGYWYVETTYINPKLMGTTCLQMGRFSWSYDAHSMTRVFFSKLCDTKNFVIFSLQITQISQFFTLRKFQFFYQIFYQKLKSCVKKNFEHDQFDGLGKLILDQ